MCRGRVAGRGAGESAGLELKASESTAPAAPTRKARHDHLTRKRHSRKPGAKSAQLRGRTEPHMQSINMPQREPIDPYERPSSPSSTCPPTCSSAVAGSPATTDPSRCTTPPAAKSSRTSPTPASNRGSKPSTPPATPAPAGRQPAPANAPTSSTAPTRSHDAAHRSHRPAHDPPKWASPSTSPAAKSPTRQTTCAGTPKKPPATSAAPPSLPNRGYKSPPYAAPSAPAC